MKKLMLICLLGSLSACSSLGGTGGVFGDIPAPQPGRKYTIIVKQETIGAENLDEVVKGS